jgi:ribosomal protein S18 acetylase RimI-like enzyme
VDIRLLGPEDAAVLTRVASGVFDKPPELWIDEVGVAPSHQRRGIGQQVLRAMFRVGTDLGCREAWVVTNRSNTSGMRLYGSVGGNEDPEDTVMFTFRLAEGEAEVARSQRNGADD